MKETMTVHKALAELKLLDSRCEKAISSCVFCVANKKNSNKIDGIDKEEYIKGMQASYDSAADLIKRETAIKKAVSLSNAITKVTICGTDYTVAEAIGMKNHGIKRKKTLLERMKNHLAIVQERITSENFNLDDKADRYIIDLYGSKEIKEKSEEMRKSREQYIENHQYVLIDPLKIKEKIEKLEEEINAFMAEVDSELSCSNALTEIEIEY